MTLLNRVRGSSNSLLHTTAARLDMDGAVMQHWIRIQLEKDTKIHYDHFI